MTTLEDPSMVEIIKDFCTESEEIFNELEEMLEDYEDQPSPNILETFGQTIDRVMGAAKSIEATYMGSFCELGKTISYKASQSTDHDLLNIAVSILFDNLEILKEVNKKILNDKTEKVEIFNLEAFGTRLKWLSDKFKNIERSSIEVQNAGEILGKAEDQKSIDDLLAELGL